MILVTGPNGNVGTELVRMLAAQDKLPYKVAAHTPEKIDRLYGTHVPRVRFDFADQSTWDETLRDVTTVFLLYPLPHPRTVNTWMLPFIAAMARSGVEHIVYISVPTAADSKVVPHYKVERAIEASGVSYTLLRAAFFSQNLCRDITTHAVDIAKYNQIYIPAGKGVTSFIDSRDVAELSLRVMESPEAHRNQAYVVTGPEKLDFYEVADIFTDVLGRKITYAKPTILGFWLRVGPRVTWDTLLFMTAVYALTRFGKNAPMTESLPELLGRPARTMRDFVEDYRDRFTGEAAMKAAKVATPGVMKKVS
jgi:uncharacterized protein YbjT (DUF2867 family)